MNPRHLIDSIVQQTTVLVAQLSTAAGLRSPLAHVVDEVFLSLAQEIERQGVSRKVVADMFGLALRSYQRKVQRLEESGSVRGQTLWEAVLDHVSEHAPLQRRLVFERFRSDDEAAITAVLTDLVASGFLYSSGRGDFTVYGATSEADRKVLSIDEAGEGLAILVWGTVFRSPGLTTAELLRSTRASEGELRAALARLLADGRVTRTGESDDDSLPAAPFVIEVGDPQGWEAAVFDHYQALANAVTAKLRQRAAGNPEHARVGGTTLHFGIHAGHPCEERVLGLLQRTRDELELLWDEVVAFNRAHPIPDEAATRVTFYFGQSITPPLDADLASELQTEQNEEGFR